MIKALLKEGDIESALRVLDEGDRAKIGRKAAIEKYYINIYDHCFGKTNTNDRNVHFFPDLITEREQRLAKELERASRVSQHEVNRIKERIAKTKVSENLPVSYSDFKSKHFNMVKTLKNNTQQMLLMKMIRAAVKDSDYHNINKLFSYLLVNKEEEDLKRLTRNKIEAYSKIHNPSLERLSFKEANDPLRILFDYVKKPYDDIDTLTNKYFLLVPDLHKKLAELRARKEILHRDIKHLIKEDDALFMSNHAKDLIEHLDISELENFGFDLDNESAKSAISQIMRNYEKLMEPLGQLEKNLGLTEKQITTARQIKILSPDSDYDQILMAVEKAIGTSFEDKPEHILAELVHIQNDKNLSQEFYDKYNQDKLEGGVRKRNIDKLLKRAFDVRKMFNPEPYENNEVTDPKLNIFEDKIQNYYDIQDNIKETKFINHVTGEEIKVDAKKLIEDPQYFTSIVAKLAKTEIENTVFKHQSQNQEQQRLINAVMKSREFRKFYYFTRRFFYEKTHAAAAAGFIDIDQNGEIFYKGHPTTGKFDTSDLKLDENETMLKEDESALEYYVRMKFYTLSEYYKQKLGGDEESEVDPNFIPSIYDETNQDDLLIDSVDHVEQVFQPPSFDISNFKNYIPQEEYQELVSDFGKYVHGGNEEEKVAFVKSKLLGHNLDTDIKNAVSENLKLAFDYNGLQVDSNVKPSKVLSQFSSAQISGLNTEHNKYQQNRKQFESIFKGQLNSEWAQYKQQKINEYLRSQNMEPLDNKITIDFENLDDRVVLENLRKIDALNNVSSLIDMTESQDRFQSDISKDHVAFEFFDNISALTDFEYTKYENDLHKEIYGDDKFDKGHADSRSLASNYKDLYFNDHPLRTPYIDDQSEYKNLLNSGLNSKKRNQDSTNETPLSKMEYLKPTKPAKAPRADTNEFKDSFEDRVAFYNNPLELDESLEDPQSTPKVDYKHAIEYIEKYDDEGNVEYIPGDPEVERENDLLTTPGRSLQEDDEYNVKESIYNQTLSDLQYKLEESIKGQKED